MKKKLLFLFTSMFFTLLAFTSFSQDMAAANPKFCKVLNENAGMKMVLVTLKPGEQLATHTHPGNIMYVLKGGVYKWTYTHGKTVTLNLKEGDHLASPPEEAHKSWNAGKTTIEFLIVEKNS